MKHWGINSTHLAFEYEMFVYFSVFVTSLPTFHQSQVIRRKPAKCGTAVADRFATKPSQAIDVERPDSSTCSSGRSVIAVNSARRSSGITSSASRIRVQGFRKIQFRDVLWILIQFPEALPCIARPEIVVHSFSAPPNERATVLGSVCGARVNHINFRTQPCRLSSEQ